MTIENRTIFEHDNLEILRGMETASADLIYLDPPFNSNKTYEAPIGSDAAGAAFKDSWTMSDVKQEWHDHISDQNQNLYRAIQAAAFTHSENMSAYLIMMSVRMLEMKRILKPTGSIYLHCDDTASHYLKMSMDCIFGVENFKNEIVWCYKASNSPVKNKFRRKHDTILFYSYNSDNATFNNQFMPYDEEYIRKTYRHIDEDGRKYRTHTPRADGSERRYYLDEGKGTPVLSWWTDIKGFGTNTQSKERCGYPTQKPLALLQRIIKASSNQGDLVLDPFCGCATTCVAAEQLGRQWIGIDISPKAVELVRMRLEKEVGMFGDVHHRTDVPSYNRSVTLVDHREEIVESLYQHQKNICPGCFESFRKRNLTVDHIVPKSKGGSDDISNLQLLCQACNSTKNNGTMEDLAQRNLANGDISEEQYRKIIDTKDFGSKSLIEPKTSAQILLEESKARESMLIEEAKAFKEKFLNMSSEEVHNMEDSQFFELRDKYNYYLTILENIKD